MKLLIVGANGFVATELIRQSLRITAIDSVLAVSRRATVAPTDPYPDSDISKLRSLVVKDYDIYDDKAKAEFESADACIWTVAITPTKSKQHPFEEVTRVCHDCTIKGIDAILEARAKNPTATSPFRFMYMSGIMVDRDPEKVYDFMPEYGKLRSRTERALVEMAERPSSNLEFCAVRPGLIIGLKDYLKPILAFGLRITKGVPSIDVDQLAAGMLHEAIHGFSKDPIIHEDLVRIGEAHLQK